MAHQGKTVLVTGAGGGLGRAIAECFLTAGANVVICEINTKLLADYEQKVVTAYPGRTLALLCDVTSEDALDDLFAQTEKKFGHFDYVINSAGIMDKVDPIGEMSMEIYDKVMAVNLRAPAMIMKRAVNMFIKHNVKGAIVNISSIAGHRGFSAGAAYTATKHGLIGLTKNTATFYHSKGIRANAIAVGGMQTNITDAFANGVNEDGLACMKGIYPRMFDGTQGYCDVAKVAKLVAYLCSDDADVISGAVYNMDDAVSAS